MASTFAYQESLPRLPIPDLKQTCDKYLKSLVPLLSPEEFQRTKAIVQDFVKPGGEGEALQQKLQYWSDQQWAVGKTWLQDWWFKYAYLVWPEPLPVWTSPFYLWPKVKDAPQIFTAARLSYLTAKWKLEIFDTGKLEPEMMGKTPLCMDQFRRMFTTVRYPGKECDSLSVIKPSSKVVVICRRQFYSFDILDSQGKLIPCRDVEAILQKIWDDAHATIEQDYSVGLFTTEERPIWAKLRAEIEKDPVNSKNLEEIDQSLFVVVLEDERPETDNDALYLVAGGDGSNRWFDKTFNIIVFNNGRAGMNNEHTPAEATTPLVIMEWVVLEYERLGDRYPDEGKTVSLHQLRPFQWQLSKEVKETFPKSQIKFMNLWRDLDLKLIYFTGFGTNWAKERKVSPDAIVQMGLQLAYFRLHGKPVATYETAHLRQFQNGRTETIRSCSSDSAAFTAIMGQPSASPEVKLAALEKAVDAHRKYTLDAMQAKGCDRHLLGLRIIAASEGQSPAIFVDPAYKLSSTFKLSTSTVFTTPRCLGTFGPVTLEGYGICYQMWADKICIGITSRFQCGATSSSKMARHVEQALLDIKDLIDYKAKAKAKI